LGTVERVSVGFSRKQNKEIPFGQVASQDGLTKQPFGLVWVEGFRMSNGGGDFAP